jgi:hypothetical protein
MDESYRDFARRNAVEYVSAEEIIRRRQRVGACIICGRTGQVECGCIGVYLYKDDTGRFRLKRDCRATLPCAIVTATLPHQGQIEAILLNMAPNNSKENYPYNDIFKLSLEDIVDLDVAIRGGVNIDEEEKRNLSLYLTALEEASDLREIEEE